MHACAEHFDWADHAGGCDTGNGAGGQGGVGVRYVVTDGAVWVEAEGVVAGEVDNVGRDGHDQGGGEATPKGCRTLVAGDFAQAVEGGGDLFAAGFINYAVSCGSCGGSR